ncbi:hypothetical protein GF406_17460 [candidate division KSB1 bacterium]|nr:hypothetical protein [candidate division KSB1 bacterium]
MIKTAKIVFFIFLGIPWVSAQGGDATEEFALQLLSRYSPDGAEIVNLAGELQSSQTPFKVSDYLENDSRKSLLSSLNTVVHEACHELTRFKGEEIAADSLDIPVERISNVLYFYLSESRFMLVNRTKTFPSRDMVDTIPDRMRTFRFNYIDTPEVLQSTQVWGIYGLLNEFNAYVQGTRASLDLYSYYAELDRPLEWLDYFQNIDATLYGGLEFRYYILSYLLYARQRRPDIYEGLMNNLAFIHAFFEVDELMRNTIQEYAKRKKFLFRFLSQRGMQVVERNGMLLFHHGHQTISSKNFQDVVALLQKEMNQPRFLFMLNTLKNRIQETGLKDLNHKVLESVKQSIAKIDADLAADRAALANEMREMTMKWYRQPLRFRDKTEDVPYAFMDMQAADVHVDSHVVWAHFDMVELPQQMHFNQRRVRDNKLEYEWAVYFDLDGDEQDDLGVSVSRFKYADSEPVKGSLVKHLQSTFWRFPGTGKEILQDLLPISQINNHLIFRIPREPHLRNITPETRVRFEISHRDGRYLFMDELLYSDRKILE